MNYNGKSRAIWSTHPIEKPYLIYQIGSADPELAVKAAKTVMNDVSGIDLNCGCPKPFSTSGGMGAALLTNPDLLCSILTALRNAMPPEISVSAKIRLLPTQEDTLELVEKIINTGVSALTVHCRTRNMRKTEKATIERLKGIVEFVEKMGKGVAVIENGDCLGYEDANRVREVTGRCPFQHVRSHTNPSSIGAHSVMIATAAEANPSCFSPTPLVDVHRTLVPTYLRVVSAPIIPLLRPSNSPLLQSRYLGNHWANSKFCGIQFRGNHVESTRAEEKGFKDKFAKAKSYDDVDDVAGDWVHGNADFEEICRIIEARPQRTLRPTPTATTTPEGSTSSLDTAASDAAELSEESQVQVGTPKEWRPNPHLDEVLKTPRIPLNLARIPIPAAVSGRDEPTPTPSPLIT